MQLQHTWHPLSVIAGTDSHWVIHNLQVHSLQGNGDVLLEVKEGWKLKMNTHEQ